MNVDIEPTTILISGGIGTGKTTLRLAAPQYFRTRFGETAAIDMDDIYMLIDPDWSQENEEWGPIACRACALLAQNFFEQSFKIVLLTGNGLYHPEVNNLFLEVLLPHSRVFHFTLEPELEILIARVRKRGDSESHPPDMLSSWLELVRSHRGQWTQVIDNTHLAPQETLEVIAHKIQDQQGSLTDLICTD
ncbi:hypothetical protein KFU94_09540 [Chloroflexi bacterium TSY]|nr:hypothetical protein [Chloroflexi bacterium TSY]